MPHDQIEFAEPKTSTCECCGEVSTHLVRYVTRDGNAFAIYYADFSPGHDFVSVLAGFGVWDEDASPDQRTAFAFRIWIANDGYQVGLIDAAEAMYDTSFLGRILDREEALSHPLKAEAFALSDHIVACDEQVIEFLTNSTATQSQRGSSQSFRNRA